LSRSIWRKYQRGSKHILSMMYLYSITILLATLIEYSSGCKGAGKCEYKVDRETLYQGRERLAEDDWEPGLELFTDRLDDEYLRCTSRKGYYIYQVAEKLEEEKGYSARLTQEILADTNYGWRTETCSYDKYKEKFIGTMFISYRGDIHISLDDDYMRCTARNGYLNHEVAAELSHKVEGLNVRNMQNVMASKNYGWRTEKCNYDKNDEEDYKSSSDDIIGQRNMYIKYKINKDYLRCLADNGYTLKQASIDTLGRNEGSQHRGRMSTYKLERILQNIGISWGEKLK